ncbi:AaceriADL011Wp [[Ashbya] aceris (nom. inval.)]|nr:AaceriADL011Wp [[Ashbya] aceris (nom. inval.)]
MMSRSDTDSACTRESYAIRHPKCGRVQYAAGLRSNPTHTESLFGHRSASFLGSFLVFIFSSLFWYIRERIRYVSHPTYSTGSPLPQRTGSADGTQDLAQKLVGTVTDECWSRKVVKQERAYVPLGKQGPIKRRWFPSSRLSALSPFITWS